MVRTTIATLTLLATLAAPASAFDIEAMSDDERAALRAEIRTYLLENPEVLMEAIAVLEQRQADAQADADGDMIAAHAEALFDDGHSWIGGNPDGDVTLVEFIDYRCSYCRRAHPEVEALIATDGNIRFIVKEFPILGEQSVLASRFAISVQLSEGDEAYKQVHDALIGMRGEVTLPALERISEEFGLDTDAIMTGMLDDRVDAIIASNRALGQSLAISGTPTFIMGDQMLRGYLPLDGMQEMLDQVRAEG